MRPVTDKPVSVLPNKRVRVMRNTNYMDIRSVHSAADDDDDGNPDDVEPAAAAESDQEAPPESKVETCNTRILSAGGY